MVTRIFIIYFFSACLQGIITTEKVRPNFKVEKLVIRNYLPFLAFSERRITVNYSLRISGKNWDIKSCKITKSYRHITEKEIKTLEKIYKVNIRLYDEDDKKWYVQYDLDELPVFTIVPQFVKKETNQFLLNSECSFDYGDLYLNVLEIVLGKEKRLIHWFRDK